MDHPAPTTTVARRILKYLALAVPIFLTFISLSSIIDGIVRWADFIQDIVTVYRFHVREPLSQFVNMLWPDTWPRIPHYVFDLFIMWSASLLALRIATLLEPRNLLLQEIQFFWTFKIGAILLGPLYVPYHLLTAWFALRATMPGTREIYRDLATQGVVPPLSESEMDQLEQEVINRRNHQWRKGLRSLTRAYLYILGAFVVILFLNWQLVEGCARPDPSLTKLGICEWGITSAQ